MVLDSKFFIVVSFINVSMRFTDGEVQISFSVQFDFSIIGIADFIRRSLSKNFIILVPRRRLYRVIYQMHCLIKDTSALH